MASTSINTSADSKIWSAKNYFGVMSLTMIIGSCWGGFVAAYLLGNHESAWLVALNIGAAMMNNVAAIAQVPFNNLMRVFLGTTIVNGMLLLYTLLD